MNLPELIKVLDKHVDEDALSKELILMYAMPKLKEWAAKKEVPFNLDEMLVAEIEKWLSE